MKRKDRGSREKMWFCEINMEKKYKRGSDVLVVGVKSEGKGSLEASLLVNISTI